MRNPWTTKNPFMSAWLSAANKVTNTARGQATAAGKREAAAIQAEAARQIVDFWSGTSVAPKSKPKTRKKKPG